ncbi:hypothetical protein FISHEDRAFT_77273 [Fistulina hepatica ATCC 64428]|uniref:Uncharacterized protein n=1 Tax=Fistulina hepatica ATCC 64428 TaxID=1128425 RepID=A0A0D7A1N1_9AGAR|nr:hypothetical protein FISHEDRAFT_77273 [Fistulina hepatica ATCC 64428]
MREVCRDLGTRRTNHWSKSDFAEFLQSVSDIGLHAASNSIKPAIDARHRDTSPVPEESGVTSMRKYRRPLSPSPEQEAPLRVPATPGKRNGVAPQDPSITGTHEGLPYATRHRDKRRKVMSAPVRRRKKANALALSPSRKVFDGVVIQKWPIHSDTKDGQVSDSASVDGEYEVDNEATAELDLAPTQTNISKSTSEVDTTHVDGATPQS